MLILKLATRNLFRQVGRNALSMVSIVMGVFVIVAGSGFAKGLDENVYRAQINDAGHTIVVPADYPKFGIDHPIDALYTLRDTDRAWLDNHSEVWTERVVSSPRLIKGLDSTRVRMVGYDPVTDPLVFPQDDWDLEGSLPSQNSSNEIVVSSGVASLLDLSTGQVIVVEVRTADGALNAMQLTVTGIVNTGAMFFDKIGVMVPRSVADPLLLSAGKTSHVHARLSDRDTAPIWAEQASATVGDAVDVRTWITTTAPLIEAGAMRQSMFNFMGFALLAMAAAGIANTVLMAAFERVREIGTMRALGMTRAGVITMFATEGGWMGLMGGMIGAFFGGLLTWYYNVNGLDMYALMGAQTDLTTDYPVAAVLYLDFSPVGLLVAVGVAVIVAILASLYPAILASQMQPADAVRAEQ
jgi:putative ABC transport system permease protein